MSWTSEANGGFTSGEPWLKMTDNHERINAEKAVEDQDSIFYHYKELIALRKSSRYSEVMVYGNHTLLDPQDDKVYAYIREKDGVKVLVVSNFTNENLTRNYDHKIADVIISNYKDSAKSVSAMTLRPYESVAYEIA